MRQQNGARVLSTRGKFKALGALALHQRACGAFVCSPWSAHSGLLRAFLPILVKYTRSFNIQPAKKHSFYRYCVISWGRFSTKKTQIHLTPPAEVLFCLADLSIRLLSSGYSCYIRSPKWKWWKKIQNQTLFASLFFRIFWITFITACQPRLTWSEKKTSNHCLLSSILFNLACSSMIRQLITSWCSLEH